MTLITSITIIAVLLILIFAGYLILRYRDGDFTIKESNIIKDFPFFNKANDTIPIGRVYHIQNTYKSGRIEIIIKKLI